MIYTLQVKRVSLLIELVPILTGQVVVMREMHGIGIFL